MKLRCEDKDHRFYARYGGRGIEVCSEWSGSFENFFKDMGDCGSLTLDRIDNDRGYFKENCRWVDQKTQSNNRHNNKFISYDGDSYTVSELSERLGISYSKLHGRCIRRNWSIERVILFEEKLKTSEGA